MANLFSKNQIEAKLKLYHLDSKIIEKAREIATRWLNNVDLTKETENQESFLREFFIDILGYQAIAGKTNNSLWWESGSIVDGKKPDGILGFNLNSYKSDGLTEKVGDIRVVIELKDSSVNLDKKQQRKDYGGTPVEQGFRYASKVGGKCEFVIITNFSEIRLYKSSDQSKFHSFKLEDLANDDNKIKEFHFLLSKDRLFTKNQNQSPVHNLDTTAKGEDIEKKFYKHYSTLREEIWHNLLDLNAEKHYGRNFYLYKAQKLIDRIIFIRFCKENEALDNDVVIEALNNKYIKGKYNRMKHLFTAMNEGNPEIGIAKFNGGLFAEDKDFDCLNISDEIIDKIVILYSYDFGSDLDVNILGHIFEQSISDLENLTGDNEKKRKKDGVFYTPAYITEYIVKEAVGGWLADRKAEIMAKEGSKEWWLEYTKKLKSIKILDPACGSGAFLVKVFDYLQNEWQEVPEEIKAEIKTETKTNWNYKDILTNNIYGVDINPASVSITKLSLWLKTAHYREPLTTLDNNIKIGNSLIDDEIIAGYYSEFEGKIIQEHIKSEGSLLDFTAIEEIKNEGVKKSLAFKWEKEFKEVFKEGGFDVVVGNPPYVRQELFSNIKPELQKKYSVYNGVADLYCYFYEKATNLLTENGKLGFVTSNKWMRTNYGESLRNFILKNTKITSFIDLGGQEVFEGVGVDANIIIYKKTKAENYSFAVANNLTEFTHFESKNLNIKCFNIESNDLERQIKTKIEKIGTALKDWDIKINYGIKTGFNEAFIIDNKTKEELCLADLKSAEIIRPVLGGQNTGHYSHEWAGLWVINTHNGYKKTRSNNSPLEEIVKRINVEKDYPAIFAYLQKFQNQLEKRADKGEHWSNLRNCAYLEDFKKEKVVWLNLNRQWKWCYVEPDFFVEASLNFIASNEYVKFFLPILSSKLHLFYFKQVGRMHDKGGYMCKIDTISSFPIPQIPLAEHAPFITQAQKMLDLTAQFNEISNKFIKLLSADLGIAKITKRLEKWYNLQVDEFFVEVGKQNKNLSLSQKSQWLEHFEDKKHKAIDLQNKISKTDSEIDYMVYELYGLSNEEIKIIEEMK